jgi:prenyltransferase beta subunit
MLRKLFVMTALGTLCLLTAQAALTQNADSATIREAVNRSLSLLQTSSSTFLKNAGCASCHSQSLGALTFALARDHGFKVDDRAARQANEANLQRWETSRQRAMQGIEMNATIEAGYALLALSADHYRNSKTTDGLIHHLAGKQTPDGRWRSTSYRPPLEYSDFTATALTVRAIQQFAPEGRKQELARRIGRARAWLLSNSPKTNEERVFRLMGLRWSAANQQAIKQAMRELLARQRVDGGWAQIDSLESDAYATGQALFSLHQAGGLDPSNTAYQKGIKFLLKTQLNDGSWLVRSRSFPVIPPVESGFPHGKNQFISAAGSSWATMALVLAIK